MSPLPGDISKKRNALHFWLQYWFHFIFDANIYEGITVIVQDNTRIFEHLFATKCTIMQLEFVLVHNMRRKVYNNIRFDIANEQQELVIIVVIIDKFDFVWYQRMR